ncbi:MAG TPA: glucosamine-6-phosphate deaminase [Candidatus Methylomirabilis sp.]|nr:glucosamine-6-phosphate deaminase [Candidatus Methylomirabilis sp.]
MKLTVHESAEAMGKAAVETAARILREAIARKGQAAFIAATGASQFGFLANLVAAPGITWERTSMFHLDEYIGFSADHPASFRRYLRQRLTSRVPIGTVNFIEGDAANIQKELERLNRLLTATPIDVAFVGIGENGHLAFNDPPADFDVETPYIIVTLDEACRRQQFGEGWFKSLQDVPKRAISMSVRQIMKSAHIICTVPDRRKAQAAKACLEGEIGPRVPASILRRHPQCFLFLDREAASLLASSTLSA